MTLRPSLFARRITITQFRGYGTFELDLPSKPCVVLLSGPNGLGKTSFFEAIEWCLTASVKRLDVIADGKANPKDLVRIAKGVDAFEVGMAFRDSQEQEGQFVRTQLIPGVGTPPPSIGTTPALVAEHLRSDESRWHVTGRNLSEYLHLTHLHTQAASLRFVTFSPKDRWMRVSPLAGADRFERVRSNLINTKAALTRIRDRREQDLAATTVRKEEWESSLARVEQLRKLASARHDILSPLDVLERANRLRANLGMPAMADTLTSDIAFASDSLRAVRIEVGNRLAVATSRENTLARLRAIPRQFADINSQLAAIQARKGSLEQSLVTLRRAISDAGANIATTREKYETLVAVKARADELYKLLSDGARDREDLARQADELAVAVEELLTTEKAREDAEAQSRHARDLLLAAERRAQEHQTARRQLESIAAAEKALVEIAALTGRQTAESDRRSTLAQNVRRLDNATNELNTRLRAAENALGAALREVEEQRRTAAILEAALIAIVSHLKDSDSDCPVCGSVFQGGELRALAQNALKKIDPAAAASESLADRARTEIDETKQRLAQLNRERREIEAEIRALDEVLDQLAERIRLLRARPHLVDLDLTTADAVLGRMRTQWEGDLARLTGEIADSASVQALTDAAVQMAAAAEACSLSYDVVRERRNSRQMRVTELQARITQTLEMHPECNVTIPTLASMVEAAALQATNAKDALEDASRSYAEARTADAATRQAESAVGSQLKSVSDEERSVLATLQALVDSWTSTQVPRPIVDESLNGELEKIAATQRRLGLALDEIEECTRGLSRWQHASDLQAAEDGVRKQSNLLDHAVYSKQLDAAIVRARKAFAVAQRARDGADRLSEALSQVTADFSERALKPFDELFRRYLRALVHDERFHRIQASYEPSARSAGLRFRVALGDRDAEAENILSEGQVGEVSLAAMLAASSAFPWSRWRALLLDDPTQYNDLIHATALFDVLRNLVRFAGYQVFVSTHDNEQASFLRRKLDGVGISWVDCRYVAHEADGIVVDVSRSDGSQKTP